MWSQHLPAVLFAIGTGQDEMGIPERLDCRRDNEGLGMLGQRDDDALQFIANVAQIAQIARDGNGTPVGHLTIVLMESEIYGDVWVHGTPQLQITLDERA